MQLQRLVLPQSDICPVSEMYYRVHSGRAECRFGQLIIADDSCVSFDTYFGGFYTNKWHRYTALTHMWLKLRMRGRAVVILFHAETVGSEVRFTNIAERSVDSESDVDVVFDIDEIKPRGMYFVQIAAGEETILCGGEFGCEDDEETEDAELAVGICTYNRQQYVMHNLNVLRRDILENDASPLCGRLSVYIADNASSLDIGELQENSSIHVFPNINAGGAGGFTRCMMEVIAGQQSATHIVLMDDDAVIAPYALERTYSFLRLLKPEHKNISVGGSLWEAGCRWRQYEAGAVWNGGNMTTYGHNADLRKLGEILEEGDRSELIDFTGWWYTCIPVEQIKKKGYPLPLFLHRDDVEYGLRLDGYFVMLCGVGVWHEVFEKKMSGLSEYYDIRNMLIVNSIHCPKYKPSEFKAFLKKWYLRNLYSHRYQYIRMNLLGVRDALGGIDRLATMRPETVSKQLSEMNYKLHDASELAYSVGLTQLAAMWAQVGTATSERQECGRAEKLVRSLLTVVLGGGLLFPAKKTPTVALQPTPLWEFFRSGTVLHVDDGGRGFVTQRSLNEIKQCREEYKKTLRLIDCEYDRVSREYRERYNELTTEQFWRKYLFPCDDVNSSIE